ncbi:MAG: T9SS type A sorting domain-containing protein [Bacteroidota bacterium]
MKKSLTLLVFIMWSITTHAQSSSPEVVSCAGETYQGTNVEISWTLGELAITTIQNSSHQITQGFHQPNYVITSIGELPNEIGEIKVFPNPVSDQIEMNLNFSQSRDVEVRLMDINGRIIWATKNSGSLIKQVKKVDHLSSGTYILHFLIDGNSYSQSFKIQKID